MERRLIKNAGPRLPCSGELCHRWQTTSQSCGQLIGFTQNLGCRKSHAGSKIDLGSVFRGKDEGHPVLSFSIPRFPTAPCVAPVGAWTSFSRVTRTPHQGPESSWRKRGSHLKCNQVFYIYTALGAMSWLISGWKVETDTRGHERSDVNRAPAQRRRMIDMIMGRERILRPCCDCFVFFS